MYFFYDVYDHEIVKNKGKLSIGAKQWTYKEQTYKQKR